MLASNKKRFCTRKTKKFGGNFLVSFTVPKTHIQIVSFNNRSKVSLKGRQGQEKGDLHCEAGCTSVNEQVA